MSLYLLGRYPDDYIYWFNLAVTIPLVIIKFMYYKSQNWHYYFLDFCYYGNLCCYVFTFLFPMSKMLYICSYVYSNGIMAFGMI
jgi:hypothetical protein